MCKFGRQQAGSSNQISGARSKHFQSEADFVEGHFGQTVIGVGEEGLDEEGGGDD